MLSCSCPQNQSGYTVFGAPIFRFCKDSRGWSMVERLINTIETQGLYTVGIYRKPGAAQKIKQLKTAMNEGRYGSGRETLS